MKAGKARRDLEIEMGALRDAIADVRAAQTWTQRMYFLSPIAEAILKEAWAITGIANRKAARSNEVISIAATGRNALALAALKIPPGVTKIRGGPFEGMLYFTKSTGSLLGPKLLGRYEDEIAPWIDEAVSAGFSLIIDVGSAEGYYAVGFAVADRKAKVRAYDVDPASRDLVQQLAQENGVADRVHVGGLCDHAELQRCITDAEKALVVVDIEGYENDLLDPARAPALRQAEIIVELHEHARPGVTSRILERFAQTHAIDVASARTDQSKVAAAIASAMDPEQAQAAVPEGRRLPQLWLRMRPYPGFTPEEMAVLRAA